MEKAYLILADGQIFQGKSLGAKGCIIGETVFNTSMTGYIETLTDPSYYGQIITQTFPLIGNYGVISEDFESNKIYAHGYIVRSFCEEPSNYRCENKIDDFLKENNIIGLCDIDTRYLTKCLREAGVMNGMIISGDSEETKKILSSLNNKNEKQLLLEKIKNYKIDNAVKNVSAKDITNSTELKNTNSQKKVILWDFGAKANIKRELEKRGVTVIDVAYDKSAEDILALKPDGIMLSNGPGDPAENIYIIEQIKKIFNAKIPIFGICLGHQMLALAEGAKTSKLKYGHRGANQPVKEINTNKVYITSQNHGYAVENNSIPQNAKITFINTNDNTCEGLEYLDCPAFSVQFHPEACGGPHDTNFLFDKFIALINGGKYATK